MYTLKEEKIARVFGFGFGFGYRPKKKRSLVNSSPGFSFGHLRRRRRRRRHYFVPWQLSCPEFLSKLLQLSCPEFSSKLFKLQFWKILWQNSISWSCTRKFFQLCNLNLFTTCSHLQKKLECKAHMLHQIFLSFFFLSCLVFFFFLATCFFCLLALPTKARISCLDSL